MTKHAARSARWLADAASRPRTARRGRLLGILLQACALSLGSGCSPSDPPAPVANVSALSGAQTMEEWAEGASVFYEGTFTDEFGHEGPLSCLLTRRPENHWNADFAAANEGEGPNQPFTRSTVLGGGMEGDEFVFAGEVPMKAGGPYVMRAVLTGDGALRANFERKAGGWPGTFALQAKAQD